MIELRKLTHEDASRFIEFLRLLDEQSEFMYYEKDERKMTPEGMRSRLKKMENQNNAFIVGCFDNDNQNRIVGYFSVNGGQSKAKAHSANVAIGMLKSFQRLGLANRLFVHALGYATRSGIQNFICGVVELNTPAIAFYKKIGFEVVGFTNHSFRTRDGHLVAEYILERHF